MKRNSLEPTSELNIERVEIGKLISDPANLREHSDRNIEAIRSSLVRFGQQKPIVIDSKNVIHAGNGTLEAAKSLDWDSLYCVRSELTGSDLTAFAIADNRTAELANWDEEALIGMLNGLATESEELLESTGFSETDLANLMNDSSDAIGGLDESITEVREVVVSCSDEAEQKKIFDRLTEEGWKCRVLTM